MQDRLATKKQLYRRGIINQGQDAICVFCQLQLEDLNHVLLHCSKMNILWRKVQILLELDIPLVEDCCNHMIVLNY